MNDAFLPTDVCRALVEAGMVVGEHWFFWWFKSEGGWLLDCRRLHIAHRLYPDAYTPAVTPLQALDWLVASGRIGGYMVTNNGAISFRPGDHGPRDAMRPWPTNPTDLVRAILEAA